MVLAMPPPNSSPSAAWAAMAAARRPATSAASTFCPARASRVVVSASCARAYASAVSSPLASAMATARRWRRAAEVELRSTSGPGSLGVTEVGEQPAPRQHLAPSTRVDADRLVDGREAHLDPVPARSRPRPRNHHGRTSAPIRRSAVVGIGARRRRRARPEVVVLGVEAVEPVDLVGAADPGARRPPAQATAPAQVRRPRTVVALAGLGEPVEAVGPQRLEHAEAGRCGPRCRPRAATCRRAGLIDVERVRPADRLGGVDRRPAGEHGEAAGTPAARRRRAGRSSSRSPPAGPSWRSDGRGRCADEQPEPVVEPAAISGDGQRLGAGRGELDGERQAVEAAAQLDQIVVVVGVAKSGLHRLGPLDEQRGGVVVGRAARAAPGARRRPRAAHGWWPRSAAGAPRQELRDELGRGVERRARSCRGPRRRRGRRAARWRAVPARRRRRRSPDVGRARRAAAATASGHGGGIDDRRQLDEPDLAARPRPPRPCSRASRVLPTPAGPTTSPAARRRGRRQDDAAPRRRPTNDVSGVGSARAGRSTERARARRAPGRG